MRFSISVCVHVAFCISHQVIFIIVAAFILISSDNRGDRGAFVVWEVLVDSIIIRRRLDTTTMFKWFIFKDYWLWFHLLTIFPFHFIIFESNCRPRVLVCILYTHDSRLLQLELLLLIQTSTLQILIIFNILLFCILFMGFGGDHRQRCLIRILLHISRYNKFLDFFLFLEGFIFCFDDWFMLLSWIFMYLGWIFLIDL